MYQKRCPWSIGVITLALSIAACQQAEEPTAPSGTAPGVSQPQQKKSVTEPAAPSGAVPEAGQPAQKTAAPAPLQEFLQEISSFAPLRTMQVNETVTMPVTVKNIGKQTWPATGDREGKNAVHLAYHWLDKEGKTVVGDENRTGLPHDLAPGESVSLDASIQAPKQVGDFRLRLTMVQETVTWFETAGAQPLDVPVTVTAQ